MHIVFFLAVFGIGCFSGWQLRRPQSEAQTDRQQKLVAIAIRLLPWLCSIRSRHQHQTWEIEQGLDLGLMLRNPWQFQEAFRLPELSDTAALQDLWALEPASFSQVTKFLVAVSDYNVLVDSAPQRLLRESSNSLYSADLLSRFHAIGVLAQTAATALEQIVGVPFETEPKQPALKSAA